MTAKLPDGVVNIHGKQYETVALRVKKFRTDFPTFTLKTQIIYRDENCVVMEAQILDDSGRMIANGHSEEYRGASTINKTSALENSETSAIGRALAAFGLGGTEFATADEVANAIKNKQPASVAKMELQSMPEDEQKFLADLAASVLENWPDEVATFSAYTQAKKGLDSDETTAFWSFFDSKQRASIKKIEQMQLAGQA